MSDDLIVGLLILGIFLVSLAVELLMAYFRHDTISATIFRWYRSWPPLGFLAGLLLGLLGSHLFFPAGCF